MLEELKATEEELESLMYSSSQFRARFEIQELQEKRNTLLAQLKSNFSSH